MPRMARERLQAALSASLQPEPFVREVLEALEERHRRLALLALGEWARLQQPTPELFFAIAGLQRPSWGTWNGLLLSLQKARRRILSAEAKAARAQLEGTPTLERLLGGLQARLTDDEASALQPLRAFVRAEWSARPRVADVLALPIALRNRVAHDAPSDPRWWSEAADAVSPLVAWHVAHSLGETDTPRRRPWFLDDDGDGGDHGPWILARVSEQLTATYDGPAGASVVRDDVADEVWRHFEALLGGAGADERDLARLLARHAPAELRGVRLGDLVVGAPVGEGGFARVHEGVQLSTGRKVAVKILRDGMSAEMQARFRQEASFLSRFQHRHIVGVLGYGNEGWTAPRDVSLRDEPWFDECFGKTAPEKIFIALDWLEGETLDALFARGEPGAPALPFGEIAELFRQAADAIATVHGAALVHRDIKPSNLMLGPTGIVLMDFGIADESEAPRDAPTATATETATAAAAATGLGTLAYMSPEQIRAAKASDEVSLSTDVYSLGATFYELFTGRRLHDHDLEAPATVETRKLEGVAPTRPSLITAGLPWELETILEGCLQPDPRDRYPSALALVRDLERFAADEPLEYRRPSLPRRARLFYRRNRQPVRLSAAFAAIAAAGVVFSIAGITAEQGRLEAERADEARQRDVEIQQKELADGRKVKVVRLSDAEVVARLRAEAPTLWPTSPDELVPVRRWLEAARGLKPRLVRHRRHLAELRGGAAPMDAADAARRRAAHPDHARWRAAESLRDALEEELRRADRWASTRALLDVADLREPLPAIDALSRETLREVGAWRRGLARVENDARLAAALGRGRAELETATVADLAAAAEETWYVVQEIEVWDAAPESVAAASAAAGELLDELDAAALGLIGALDDGLTAFEAGDASELETAYAQSGELQGRFDDHLVTALEAASLEDARARFGALDPAGRGDAYARAARTLRDELVEEQRAPAERLASAVDRLAAALVDDVDRVLTAGTIARARALLDRTSALAVRLADLVEPRRFASTELGWEHDVTADLVRTLDAFGDTVAAVEARLDLPERWRDALARIADRAESPRHDGLTLPPQPGLVPLGPDPASGLWELWHPGSGDRPRRDADGRLVPTEASGLVFVLVPGGAFAMGAATSARAGRPVGSPNVDEQSGEDEADLAGRPRRVELQPFLISKYEMTQGQWTRLFGANPSSYDRPDRAAHPVEMVSWEDCLAALPPAGLDLPTEAQWEYAARGGTSTVWWTGDDPESLAGAADLAQIQSLPVGTVGANGFGLHDVVGNVWEWCRERDGYYDAPLAPGDGERTWRPARGLLPILRGGFVWSMFPANVNLRNSRSAARGPGTWGMSWRPGPRGGAPTRPDRHECFGLRPIRPLTGLVPPPTIEHPRPGAVVHARALELRGRFRRAPADRAVRVADRTVAVEADGAFRVALDLHDDENRIALAWGPGDDARRAEVRVVLDDRPGWSDEPLPAGLRRGETPPTYVWDPGVGIPLPAERVDAGGGEGEGYRVAADAADLERAFRQIGRDHGSPVRLDRLELADVAAFCEHLGLIPPTEDAWRAARRGDATPPRLTLRLPGAAPR